MVYTGDLKSPAARIEGSNPSSRTNFIASVVELVVTADSLSEDQKMLLGLDKFGNFINKE